jgi:hypothetical protein
MAVGKNKASLKIPVFLLEYVPMFPLQVHFDSQMFLQKEEANTSTLKVKSSVYFQVKSSVYFQVKIYRRFRSFGM